MIDVRRFLAHVAFHGWENCDTEIILHSLKTMKEEGPESLFGQLNE